MRCFRLLDLAPSATLLLCLVCLAFKSSPAGARPLTHEREVDSGNREIFKYDDTKISTNGLKAAIALKYDPVLIPESLIAGSEKLDIATQGAEFQSLITRNQKLRAESLAAFAKKKPLDGLERLHKIRMSESELLLHVDALRVKYFKDWNSASLKALTPIDSLVTCSEHFKSLDGMATRNQKAQALESGWTMCMASEIKSRNANEEAVAWQEFLRKRSIVWTKGAP